MQVRRKLKDLYASDQGETYVSAYDVAQQVMVNIYGPKYTGTQLQLVPAELAATEREALLLLKERDEARDQAADLKWRLDQLQK